MTTAAQVDLTCAGELGHPTLSARLSRLSMVVADAAKQDACEDHSPPLG